MKFLKIDLLSKTFSFKNEDKIWKGKFGVEKDREGKEKVWNDHKATSLSGAANEHIGNVLRAFNKEIEE